jgi:recombinational DNA repair ATPase RecF
MPIRIKNINIKAFRGIPDLELELDEKSLLVKGDNATGKSSIVEAIEFFFTGKISYLEGVQGLSLQQHGTHVNFSPNDVKVEITFNPGTVSVRRTFKTPPATPEFLKDFLKTAQSGSFILRRSQILEFIMSQPAERFRAIGSIIGIEKLDSVELQMMKLRDVLKGEVDSKEAEIKGAMEDISDLLDERITKIEHVLPPLNKILQIENLPLIKSLDDAGKHAEEMFKSVKKADNLDKITVLGEILNLTETPFISDEIVTQLTELNNKVVHLLKDEIRLERSFVNLLETGLGVIEEKKMEFCPLCEQKIEREQLLQRIKSRIATLRDLSEMAAEVRSLAGPIKSRLEGILNRINSILSKVGQFFELSEEKKNLEEISAELIKFVEEVVAARDLMKAVQIQKISEQKGKIETIMASLTTKCKDLMEVIGLSDKEKRVIEIARLIEFLRTKTKQISTITSQLEAYKKYLGLAEKIYSTFSETKKSKIQGIYNTIQGDIQSYYSTLHPDQLHKNLELVVVPGRRASTKMTIESFGRSGVDPRAFTSEGYLDSLGLCIFLAFVKRFCDDSPLIVLDDVVTTVDARHRLNICKLLWEEFGDKQLIITTHDGVWYQQLLSSLRAYGMEGQFKNLMIVDWDVDTGPQIQPYKPRWERIQENIAGGNKTGAGNDGRTYLEWLLKEICKNTNAPVPIQNWEKGMVADLSPHAKRRILAMVDDETFKEKVASAFQDLESTAIFGNIVSHDNPLAEELSIDEVEHFCNCTRNLHELFLCPECKSIISYFPELRILRCKNPRCKNPMEVRTK